MSNRSRNFPVRSVPVELLAGDASKTIYTPVVVNPTQNTKEQVVVVAIHVMSLVAAAQVVYLQDNDGTNKVFKIPASWPLGYSVSLKFEDGLEMKQGEPLILKPAAAGPAQFWIVEFFVRS